MDLQFRRRGEKGRVACENWAKFSAFERGMKRTRNQHDLRTICTDSHANCTFSARGGRRSTTTSRRHEVTEAMPKMAEICGLWTVPGPGQRGRETPQHCRGLYKKSARILRPGAILVREDFVISDATNILDFRRRQRVETDETPGEPTIYGIGMGGMSLWKL